MVKLREFDGDGFATSVTFAEIQQNLNSLLLVGYGRTAALVGTIDGLDITFNSDVGANYDELQTTFLTASTTNLSILGAAAFQNMAAFARTNAPANNAIAFKVCIDNYADSTFFKVATGEYSSLPDPLRIRTGGRWNDTSAITSITLTTSSLNSMLVGSKIILYGRR